MTERAATVRLVLGRELAANLRTFLLWFVPVALLLTLNLAMQPSIAGDGGVLAAKLDAMPEAMRRAFGITALDFTRPPAFLSTNFIYVTLTASLLGGTLGATIVAKEEALRTAELLLTPPVAREHVLAGKAIALAIYVIGFDVALALVAIAVAAALIDAPTEPALIASLFGGTAALGACFAGVGMLLGTLVRVPRNASNAALGVVLGMFLINAVAAAFPRAEALSTMSPFRAVEPGRIVVDGGIDPIVVIVLVTIGLAGGGLAVWRYRGRDIHA